MNFKMIHIKCRSELYPLSKISRFIISDEQVPWSFEFTNYSPTDYDSPVLHNKPWADLSLDDLTFKPKWNQLDGNINRKSHCGLYQIYDKRPLNPIGRTGLKGRGLLGRWGPNHAADPIVTRWKFTENTKTLNAVTKVPILQFCAIQRKDCGQWALPGGMVEPGEKYNETLKREFLEEAFNSLECTEGERHKNSDLVHKFFDNGTEVYKGYVDDPRNTDNAWMETVAVNFHDDDNSMVGKFKLQAGDDAKNVKWVDIDSQLDLYASHSNLIEAVAKLRKAHW